MRKIIDSKLYDTEKAEQIARYHNGLSHTDFNNLSERLYRTEKGNFFLHGSGGALTKYSESAGNMRSGSEDITPLSEGEAYGWLEEHNKVSEIKRYFPDYIEEA